MQKGKKMLKIVQEKCKKKYRLAIREGTLDAKRDAMIPIKGYQISYFVSYNRYK